MPKFVVCLILEIRIIGNCRRKKSLNGSAIWKERQLVHNDISQETKIVFHSHWWQNWLGIDWDCQKNVKATRCQTVTSGAQFTLRRSGIISFRLKSRMRFPHKIARKRQIDRKQFCFSDVVERICPIKTF